MSGHIRPTFLLSPYLRPVHATPEESDNWELISTGQDIHWPNLDEQLSVEVDPSSDDQAPMDKVANNHNYLIRGPSPINRFNRSSSATLFRDLWFCCERMASERCWAESHPVVQRPGGSILLSWLASRDSANGI